MQESSSELNLELARVVLRQGEKRLDAQLQIGIAADQRAMILAGIWVAIATMASGISLYFLGKNDFHSFWAAMTTIIFLLISSMLCVFATWPEKFGTVGAQPQKWWGDNVENRLLAESLLKESENYQKRITTNFCTNIKKAALFKKGAILGCTSPILGILVWFFIHLVVEK